VLGIAERFDLGVGQLGAIAEGSIRGRSNERSVAVGQTLASLALSSRSATRQRETPHSPPRTTTETDASRVVRTHLDEIIDARDGGRGEGLAGEPVGVVDEAAHLKPLGHLGPRTDVGYL
jgi:hypothetical protein